MLLLQEERPFWSSKETFILAGLMMAAFAVRLPHLMAAYVINPDAIDYIESAKALAMGKWREGFEASHVSMFPVLIALVQPLLGDWIWSARLIPVCFGLLTVAPLYLVARRILSLPWSAVPPLLYCLCPSLTHYSMDVIREPISWFVMFAGLWVLLKARESGRPLWYAFAGAIFLLGAANRLDGLVGLGLVLVWIVGTELTKGPLMGIIKKLSFFILPTVAALSAALILLGGSWRQNEIPDFKNYRRQIQFSLQGSNPRQEAKIGAILEGISQPRLRNFFSAAWDNRHALAALELFRHWVKAAHPALLALSLLGLFAFKRWKGLDFWWLLALLMAAWLALGYFRLSGAFAISKRHLGTAVLCAYFFASLGLFQAYTWAKQKGWQRVPRGLPIVVICFLGVLSLPWTLRPQREEKLVRRLAGEWIRNQGFQEPLVASQHQAVAFYAGGSWLPIRDLFRHWAPWPDLLVVEKESTRLEELTEALEREGIGLELLQEISHADNTALLIYRLKPPTGSSGLKGAIGQGLSLKEPVEPKR